ncbi:chondroadherin-like protein [Parasteatoda tepidariorum]|uniref:chondroadherin-like protein n=1 Tax=Parasteatoda tepidariorum TaxID=114398 RepID=UPI001C71DF98|nr:connectin-like [Parasteatoda tepidariorum]
MLVFIQILSLAVAALALDCPPKDKVYPCSCAEEQGRITINCEGFNSISELEPAVKNTIGYNVNFGFYRSHLGAIPSDFFKGHTSVKISFQECIVFSFGDTPFSGLEDSLEILDIYTGIDQSVTKTDTFRLGHLKKLKYFTFGHNDIAELGNRWFEDGPASMQQLSLESNNIEKVGDKALSTLVNLEQLFVNNNHIKVVARSMLPNPARNLWVLEAKTNEIEELPSDTFEGYPSLKIVNLSQNKLTSITESVWGKVWSQLRSVYLEGNDIICDGNLKWIYRQKLPADFKGKCGPGNNLQSRALDSLKLEDFQ